MTAPDGDPLHAALTTAIQGIVLESVARDRRFVLGLVGEPGAGKSTVADLIADLAGPDLCRVVRMDGFHLHSDVLAGTERAARRGAIDTFDVGSFVSVLQRIRRRDEPSVVVPSFSRTTEEPVGSAVDVPRELPLVVVEGNYLLDDDGRWRVVRELLDEVWLVQRPTDVRMGDLIARHERHGKAPADARAWATGSDERNAHRVRAVSGRADLVIDVDGQRLLAAEHRRSHRSVGADPHGVAVTVT